MIGLICQATPMADTVVITVGAQETPSLLTGCVVDVSGVLPDPDTPACVCQARGPWRPGCRAEFWTSDDTTSLACVASWVRDGTVMTETRRATWRKGKRVR
jgi:hypothetical protein